MSLSKISSHHYHCNNDAKDLRQFLSRLLDSCVVLKTLQHCSRQARTSVQPSFCKLTYFSNPNSLTRHRQRQERRITSYWRIIKGPSIVAQLILSMLLLTLNSTHAAFIMCQEGNCCLQALCRHSGLSQLLAVLQQSAAVSRVLQAPTHIQCSHPGTRHRQTVVPVPACV